MAVPSLALAAIPGAVKRRLLARATVPNTGLFIVDTAFAIALPASLITAPFQTDNHGRV